MDSPAISQSSFRFETRKCLRINEGISFEKSVLISTILHPATFGVGCLIFLIMSLLGIKFDLKVVIQSFLYDGSKYARIKNQIYKIERTYLNGHFLELYLVSSDIEVEQDA